MLLPPFLGLLPILFGHPRMIMLRPQGVLVPQHPRYILASGLRQAVHDPTGFIPLGMDEVNHVVLHPGQFRPNLVVQVGAVEGLGDHGTVQHAEGADDIVLHPFLRCGRHSHDWNSREVFPQLAQLEV